MYKLKASIEFIETVSVDKVARTGQKIEEMNEKFTNEKKNEVTYLYLYVSETYFLHDPVELKMDQEGINSV